MSANSIYCPGKVLDGGGRALCKAIIPEKIVCTKANKGLACIRCGLFEWLLEPPQAGRGNILGMPNPRSSHPPSSPFRLPAAFAPTQQEENWARALHEDGSLFDLLSDSSSWLTPNEPLALPMTQPNASTSAARPAEPSGRCATVGCKGKLAAKCTKKRCCASIEGPCGPHKVKRALSSTSAPYKLARPLPSVSTTSSIPGASAPASADHPFEFAKPMDPLWEADWDRNRLARQARDAANPSRIENERLLKHQVSLWTWFESDQPAIFTCIQGVKTWPTLNLHDLEELPTQLETTSTNGYQVFHEGSCTWLRNLKHAMRVTTNQNLYIRAPGVTICPGLDQLRQGLTSTKRALAATPESIPRKKYRYRSPSSRSSSPSPLSPSSSSSTPLPPFMIQTPFLMPPPIPPLLLPTAISVPDPSSTPDTDDDSCEEDSVHVPEPGVFGPWPGEMYACDMARGFELVGARPSKTSFYSRFSVVFPGV